MPTEEDCHSEQWQTEKRETVLRAGSGEQAKKNAVTELVTCARTSLDSQVRQLEYLSRRVRGGCWSDCDAFLHSTPVVPPAPVIRPFWWLSCSYGYALLCSQN